MLNSSLKKEAIEKLRNSLDSHEKSTKKLQNRAISLHNSRSYGVDVINKLEEYINTLANTPKEFEKTIEKVEFNIASFKALTEISFDEKEIVKLAGGGAALGVAAAIATAAIAPTAAMAIATTFGVASTGTLISTLTGAAATNAALAWLGGGAIVAGGSGMAGGGTLLALAGPIGWGIGAASLAAGGIIATKKNKDVAIKADKERVEILKSTKAQEAMVTEITKLKASTETLAINIEQSLITFVSTTKRVKSYTEFSQEEKDLIRALLNNTESLSQLFKKEIGN